MLRSALATLPKDAGREAFEATLNATGLAPTNLKLLDGTIQPPTTDAEVEAAVADLPVISQEDRELRVMETLGEGGMGVVRRAEQVPLHRTVAVKSLREGQKTPEATLRLMREAWITGGLEHPNIVPVYTLGRSREGYPLLVMKRIEGRVWAELLRESGRPPHAPDWARQVGILIQVCRALELAHHHGILHRDLKPDNVMIGNFGEVYVLDWGIALSLDDDHGGRLPVVANAIGMAGTPSYMAPEMVDDRCDRLSVRSDVYLVGAVLHEILTGRPPHLAGSITDMLFHAHKGTVPEHPPEAPLELSEICRRALAPDPEDRHASIAELRESLEAFLRHRSSESLAAEAKQRLAELEAMFERGIEDSSELMRVFGECVFGFKQALREWPDNRTAREGLVRAVERVARRAIAKEDASSLEHALAQLPAPVPELDEALRVLKVRDVEGRERLARLERLERDLDLTEGSRARTIGSIAIAFVWALLPATFWLSEKLGHPPDTKMILLDSAFGWLVVVGLVILFRRHVARNLINQRVVGSMVLTMAGVTIGRSFCFLNGLSVSQALQLDLVTFLVAAGFITLTIDLRLRLVVGVYLATFVASLLLPPSAIIWCASIGNIVAMSLIAYVWGRNPDFGCRILGLPRLSPVLRA
ncbi:MAG: protein kinase [Deltaproteobacteria bacterium]|nr:protein kinase [Deltaproteobacteria bacterium]